MWYILINQRFSNASIIIEPTDCCIKTGGMHRKCRVVDAIKPAEIELRQDPIHVAWVQTTAGEDRDRVLANRRTLHRILNLRKESGSDFWSRIEDGPACQQHNEKLLLPAETAAIHQAIAHHGHWSIPSYQGKQTTATVFSTEPRTLSCECCNPFSTRRPGWLQTQGNSTTSRLCYIGFPSAKASVSKLQPLLETHSMAVTRHISVYPSCPISEIGARAHFRFVALGHLTTPQTRTRRFGPRSFRVNGLTVELPAR